MLEARVFLQWKTESGYLDSNTYTFLVPVRVHGSLP